MSYPVLSDCTAPKPCLRSPMAWRWHCHFWQRVSSAGSWADGGKSRRSGWPPKAMGQAGLSPITDLPSSKPKSKRTKPFPKWYVRGLGFLNPRVDLPQQGHKKGLPFQEFLLQSGVARETGESPAARLRALLAERRPSAGWGAFCKPSLWCILPDVRTLTFGHFVLNF